MAHTRGSGIDILERPNAERHKITGKRLGFRELDRFHGSSLGRLFQYFGVGNGRIRLRNVQRETPGNLEIRLIEAGKGAARTDGLKLSEDVFVLVSIALEDSFAGFLIYLAGKTHGQARTTSLQGSRELEPDKVIPAGNNLRWYRLAIF